jgi:hypothetical protein
MSEGFKLSVPAAFTPRWRLKAKFAAFGFLQPMR